MGIPAKQPTVLYANKIELFALQYLPHLWKCAVPPFHREIYAALMGDDERLVVEAPRDFAKSTILSVIYPLYMICLGDEPEIQSFSRSTMLSKKWLRKIKKELETNIVLVHDFGIKRGEVWSKEHIIVHRNDGFTVELYTGGKGSSARGGRGMVFIDDPQNKADVRSATVMESDEDWFYEDIINILEPGQRCVFIGTRLSPVSLLAKAARTPGWRLLSFKAQTPDGESIWPEKWPREALEARRDEIGIDRYNSEFMNEPKVSDNPIFRSEYCQAYEQDSEIFKAELRRGLYTVTAGDLAISKRETADWTALVTISATFDPEPKFYVRDVRRARWSMKEGAEQFFRVFDEFQQSKTLIETVGGFAGMMEEVQERERIYRTYINAYDIKPDQDKARRAYVVQPLLQQGRVYFDFTSKTQQQLIDEMIMFTGEDNSLYHDDMVDAFVHCLTEHKTWAAGQQHKQVGPDVPERQVTFSHAQVAGGWK